MKNLILFDKTNRKRLVFFALGEPGGSSENPDLAKQALAELEAAPNKAEREIADNAEALQGISAEAIADKARKEVRETYDRALKSYRESVTKINVNAPFYKDLTEAKDRAFKTIRENSEKYERIVGMIGVLAQAKILVVSRDTYLKPDERIKLKKGQFVELRESAENDFKKFQGEKYARDFRAAGDAMYEEYQGVLGLMYVQLQNINNVIEGKETTTETFPEPDKFIQSANLNLDIREDILDSKEELNEETLKIAQTAAEKDYEKLNSDAAVVFFRTCGTETYREYQSLLTRLFKQLQRIDMRISDITGGEIPAPGEPLFVLDAETRIMPEAQTILTRYAKMFHRLQSTTSTVGGGQMVVGMFVFDVAPTGNGQIYCRQTNTEGSPEKVVDAAIKQVQERLHLARIERINTRRDDGQISREESARLLMAEQDQYVIERGGAYIEGINTEEEEKVADTGKGKKGQKIAAAEKGGPGHKIGLDRPEKRKA
jgi:hypothetical protein